jgi:hypothetical protein
MLELVINPLFVSVPMIYGIDDDDRKTVAIQTDHF